MLISSDMSIPILSRSSGCPLTSKLCYYALPHVFLVVLLNSFTYLLSYRFIFINVSTVMPVLMPVLSVTGWPLPYRKTHGCPLWKDMLTGPG